MLSLVSYKSSDESDTEEAATEIPSKQSGNVDTNSQLKNSKNSLSFAVPGKAKESVKITVPSLKQFEDDEKAEPSTKKIKKSSGSGLLSMLPPPKYSKPVDSQKSFVPYVLTKKQNPSSSNTVSNLARNSNSVGLSKKPTSLKKPVVQTEYHSEKELSVAEKDDHSSVTDFFSLKEPLQKSEDSYSVPVSDKVPRSQEISQITGGALQTNNLYEASSVSSANSNSSSFWGNQSEGNTGVHYSGSISHGESSTAESSCANQSLSDSDADFPELNPSPKECAANEGFLRLQGKRKGQEEINIIDVSVDDQLSDKTQWLTKSITEEKVHRSSRKKNDLPTQLQKRKHQITYLAFQAKERELELKNQWSQNRLTKRETQAKYGF